VVLGHDLLDPAYLGDAEALSGLDTVVLLDTHRSPLERVAHVALPARHAAEKLGTLTNAAGRVQRVQPSVEPVFEACSEGEALARIGRALGLPGFQEEWDARRTSRILSQSVEEFADRDFDSVGPEGRPLAGASEG